MKVEKAHWMYAEKKNVKDHRIDGLSEQPGRERFFAKSQEGLGI